MRCSYNNVYCLPNLFFYGFCQFSWGISLSNWLCQLNSVFLVLCSVTVWHPELIQMSREQVNFLLLLCWRREKILHPASALITRIILFLMVDYSQDHRWCRIQDRSCCSLLIFAQRSNQVQKSSPQGKRSIQISKWSKGCARGACSLPATSNLSWCLVWRYLCLILSCCLYPSGDFLESFQTMKFRAETQHSNQSSSFKP